MTYDYQITEVVRVVDGDTVDLKIDLGFHIVASMRFRLYGVDTPERGQKGWSEATAFTKDWLAIATTGMVELRARTYKSDSFGRWLADIYMVNSAGDAIELKTALLSSGLAVEYK